MRSNRCPTKCQTGTSDRRARLRATRSLPRLGGALLIAHLVEVVDERVVEAPDTGRELLGADVLRPTVDRFDEQFDIDAIEMRRPGGANRSEFVADVLRGAHIGDPIEESVAGTPRDLDRAPAGRNIYPIETRGHSRESMTLGDRMNGRSSD